ncbi:MAG: AAA family ATPase [Desulfobacteraceae bacterium]|jgi:KaiC/GvpD/RAD55 family RecA-like ATPase
MIAKIKRYQITVESLAEDKCIPLSFLKKLGIEDTDRGVFIPYYNSDGSEARGRFRTALRAGDGTRWAGKDGDIIPYGMDRLAKNKTGRLFIVEGESDCWTLWSHQIACIGLPGAKMQKCLSKECFKGVKTICIWQEPDTAGKDFVRKTADKLRELGYKGKLYRCSHKTCKDLNAILHEFGLGFLDELKKTYRKNKKEIVTYEKVKMEWDDDDDIEDDEEKEKTDRIEVGSRNDTLFYLGKKLASSNIFCDDELARVLQMVNKSRCDEPLSRSEIKNIVDSITSYKKGYQLELEFFSEVEEKKVRWIWKGVIPRGKLSMIAGEPGTNKSAICMDIAARLSRCKCWPVGVEKAMPRYADHRGIGTVVLSAEDATDDTLLPRFNRAGGDPEYIAKIKAVKSKDGKKKCFSLETDIGKLNEALDIVPNCKLIIIDPISSYLPTIDSHRNSDVRSVLAPLQELAEERDVAVLLVHHFNKNAGGKAIHRVSGSGAFIAAVRHAFAVVKDKDDDLRRLVIPIKSNIWSDRHGLAFSIGFVDEIVQVSWEPELIEMNAENWFGGNKSDDAHVFNQIIDELAGEEREITIDGIKELFPDYSKDQIRGRLKQKGMIPQKVGGKKGKWIYVYPEKP